MRMKIAILEDNLERQEVMRACIADRFYMYETRFFDDAFAMIEFLKLHLFDCLVIALDHDLELKTGVDGRCVDTGTGRDVADFLAANKPVCPVIIHSTNTDAVVGMKMALHDAGWKTRRVVPEAGTEWIRTSWFRALRRAIVGPVNAQR
jgi:CheY-like chemotaxis protein